MKLYFVRHGKTKWNEEGRFQGASGDSPLLESSLEEIAQLGDYLANINFDTVFSSDLKRAFDTAEIIIKHNHFDNTFIQTEQLREWKLGKLEGEKISTASAIYTKQMEAFRHNLAKFNPDIFEAESVYKTTHRVKDLVESLKDSGYENVLIIGHGANLTASIRSLLGFEPGHLRDKGGLDNTSLTILETQDCKQFKCLLWNDKSYLKDEMLIRPN